MTKMFIHIGTHKTGTTTIQHALQHASATAGAQEGWAYIKTPRAERKLMLAQTYDESVVKAFSKELAAKRARVSGEPEKLIMSAEALSGLPTDGYMNSGVVARMLRDITKDWDVKIVIYLRRQDDMTEAMYTQKIHEGFSLSFKDFISEIQPGLSYNYSRILQDWASCFGKENLIVKSYHAASERGLLEDFAEVIGSTKILHSEPGRRNPSYSYDAIQIARIANATLAEPARKQLRRVLQKTLAKQKSETHSLFTAEGRKEFLHMYKESNQDVADQFFGGVIQNVFPEPTLGALEGEAEAQKKCIAYEDAVPLIVESLASERKGSAAKIVARTKAAVIHHPTLKRLFRRIARRD